MLSCEVININMHTCMACVVSQVQDYGCALKMDDGEKILEMQYKLLSIFLFLDGPQSREYQKALTVSVHLWEWMKANNHPGWAIFKHNASVFNEESGEICFSVLAREIAGSGVRSDCEAVSSKFGLIKSKMEVGRNWKLKCAGKTSQAIITARSSPHPTMSKPLSIFSSG